MPPVEIRLVLFVVCAALAAVAGGRDRELGQRVGQVLWRLRGVWGGLLAVVLLGTASAYAAWPGFDDHIEVHIATTAWSWLEGAAMYPALGAAERTGMLYGPWTYELYGLAHAALGPSDHAVKWAAVGALGAALLATAVGFRKLRYTWTGVGALTGLLALHMSGFRSCAYWARAEPLIAAHAALAVAAATLLRGVPGAIALGALAGLAGGLKVHAPIYVAPVLVWFWGREGWGLRLPLAAGAAFVGAWALPWAAPGASLGSYLDLVGAATGHGFALELLFENVVLTGLMLAPFGWMLAARAPLGGADRAAVGTLALALCANAVVAAKIGSGFYQYVAFGPVWAFLIGSVFVEGRGGQRAAGLTWRWVIAAAAFSCGHAWFVSTGIMWKRLDALNEQGKSGDEAVALAGEYGAKRLVVGYGGFDAYAQTFARSRVVYAGGPHVLDSAAMMDLQHTGSELSEATRAWIAGCDVPVVLVPAGEEPFSLTSYYEGREVFDGEFRASFGAAYALSTTRGPWDIYECRAE